MRDKIGEIYEGTVTAMVGSGMYVSILHPFVDVLVRFEAMGPDRYELSDDELKVVGARSGDTVSLGDHVLVEIEDVAVLRRTVYARRIPPEGLVEASSDGRRRRPKQVPPRAGTRRPAAATERDRRWKKDAKPTRKKKTRRG
jgi:ribonuclease R